MQFGIIAFFVDILLKEGNTGGYAMNMLFWVWYKLYKEEQEDEDNTEYSWETIDSLIPSSVYLVIGVLCGLGTIVLSLIIFKMLVWFNII